ncbi:RluA family pseudouridine synthase [Brevibacillus aydinogluensis]|uniref:Pseudouridine synthase n=1 Tax=Brevibacillus aydinogluensis TaxID=927786 RepID=A0AA48M756_9BACL|nr:RluA family pseudouridine synthase [Brevibacillus aydinogluensis]CAJ1000858.1 Pseudouridine synthase [Brevibacillus aydinogluensis]
MSRKGWLEYVVTQEDAGLTVEQIARQKLSVSGRMLQRLTRSKGILLNRKSPFLQRQVKAGDKIAVRVQDNRLGQDKGPAMKASSLPMPPVVQVDVLFEDDHLLVVCKPAGMMVHPTRREQGNTLVHILADQYRYKGENIQIHAVHRLDKETSGVILLAKSSYGHLLADRLLREGSIKREYLAVASGVVENDADTIHAPIGRDPRHPTRRRVMDSGDPAVTHYEVIARSEEATLVRVWLETGRTHQIRVHFQHIGHPLVGDAMYGGNSGLIRRQALHAWRLSFVHPVSGEEIVCTAPMPEDMTSLITRLRL